MRAANGNAGARSESHVRSLLLQAHVDWPGLVARAEEAIGVDLETLALGTLGDATMFNPGPVNGINETLEVTLPQPAYSPQGRSLLPPALPRQQR